MKNTVMKFVHVKCMDCPYDDYICIAQPGHLAVGQIIHLGEKCYCGSYRVRVIGHDGLKAVEHNYAKCGLPFDREEFLDSIKSQMLENQ